MQRNWLVGANIPVPKQYKKGKTTWKEYCDCYTKEQREHYKKSPEDFHNLLKKAKVEDIVLLCYEKYEGSKTQCHRVLLYDLLKKVDKKFGYGVAFLPEQEYRPRTS